MGGGDTSLPEAVAAGAAAAGQACDSGRCVILIDVELFEDVVIAAIYCADCSAGYGLFDVIWSCAVFMSSGRYQSY